MGVATATTTYYRHTTVKTKEHAVSCFVCLIQPMMLYEVLEESSDASFSYLGQFGNE
jgi:H2-forming N5,N10-methylenetetrahydromethanopterin dehydrogenase-like enzyme